MNSKDNELPPVPKEADNQTAESYIPDAETKVVQQFKLVHTIDDNGDYQTEIKYPPYE